MKIHRITALALLALLPLGLAQAGLRAVASTADLASIASLVGGDLVQVDAIVRGDANPHTVEVLPSSMLKVARADLYFEIGLGLDQWARPIIDGARNGRLTLVDCSRGIDVLDVPTTKVDASMGDVHPGGNPHYWLDPANGLIVAGTVRDAFVAADPGHAAAYARGYESFARTLAEKQEAWRKEAAPLEGLRIVSFHDSWPYFARAFGLEVAGFVEPRPGIEPTPAHTAELIELIRARQVPAIVREPYFSDRVPASIAARTGARVVVLAPSVGGAEGVDDYFELFDHDIRALLAARGD